MVELVDSNVFVSFGFRVSHITTLKSETPLKNVIFGSFLCEVEREWSWYISISPCLFLLSIRGIIVSMKATGLFSTK